MGVGLLVRLAWVLVATRDPVRLTDPWHYHEIAVSFSFHATEMIGGRPAAFYPPGYPMTLAPLAWLTRKVGVLSLPMAASLLNVAAGTGTVAMVGSLARRWIGPGTRAPAAWAMALAPAPVFLTSTSFSETVFTVVAVGLVVLAGRGADRTWSLPRFAAIGVLAGYATMIRSPGFVVLLAVPLAFRASRGTWRAGLRPLLAALAAVVITLVPWTVRNGLQIGVWSPTSTNNVAFLCLGNRPGAEVAGDLAEEGRRCYRHSAMDNPALYRPGELPPGATVTYPDEAAWYRSTLAKTVRWIRENPGEQPRLVAWRLWTTWRADTEALNDAEGFGSQRIVPPALHGWADALATGWLWAVVAASVLGLVVRRACRAAWPVWGVAAAQALLVLPGIGLQRYHQPIVPFLVVLGAGCVQRRSAGPLLLRRRERSS